MEIKILVDDIAYKRYFAQHGLSILVKTADDKKILFDVGQSSYVLNKNLELMGEDDNFDSIVISHGHYDHTDGFTYFMDKYNKNKKFEMDIPVYIHPDAFLDKYSDDKRYIGIDKNIKDFLRNYKHLKLVNEPYFEDNVIISGKVERTHPYEPEIFYKRDDNNKFEVDYVNDDMFMIVDDVVITGCSHSGIINVIEYAKKINKNKIRGVIGGFHLVVSSNEYINKVYDYLKNSDLEFIMPIHCTGFNAMKVLSELDNFIYGHVGKTMEL
ncbi:MBL fold metallo-hydrolase [Methanothermococcus okinawensis]|uniref:Beta-lactamase domain-containing protein n=1 Tax=Methanothermococcus okinawensis (strain DSM 14208 / JCM 11175 / IH1) TaxID=647113 RepID=F8AKC0_METOI|nr:MBL fold metallo-hydrolase [Methanothermococcus okinawensis]AEH06320.1 beta-lactamase domain-containing protein [Methanothermococcus okinawensis IH1]